MAGMADDVRIGILGPLEVRVGFGEPVEVVGPRLRTLVIRLALDPGRVVLASQLVDGGVLTGQGDQLPHLVGLRDHVVAGDRGAPGVGLQEGGEDAHRRGLARPVGAEHGQHAPGAGLQIGSGEGGGLTEAFDQAFRLDRVAHGCSRGRWTREQPGPRR
jgi:hypothetical protein